MPSEQLAFTTMVEALIRAMGDKLDERAHKRFEALGLPLKGKLKSTYPRDVFTRAGLLAGEVAFPSLPPEQQRLELGKRFVSGYSETLVGKALLGLMRVLGPKKSLARLEQSFHTGNNYSRARLFETPEGTVLEIGDAPYPEWYQGMVIAALQLTGAKEVRVEPLKRDGLSMTYRISYR